MCTAYNMHDPHEYIGSAQAKDFYADFVQGMRNKYDLNKIKDGEFGAMMDVALVNDVSTAGLCSGLPAGENDCKQTVHALQGPVTIILDSQLPKG